jgi:hypothetical protein
MTTTDPIYDKARAIGDLLVTNGFKADDPIVVSALASILVSACVHGGVTKKNFFQNLRDLWRGAIIQLDNQYVKANTRITEMTEAELIAKFEEMNAKSSSLTNPSSEPKLEE